MVVAQQEGYFPESFVVNWDLVVAAVVVLRSYAVGIPPDAPCEVRHRKFHSWEDRLANDHQNWYWLKLISSVSMLSITSYYNYLLTHYPS